MADRNQSPPWLSTLKHQHELYDEFYWYLSPHLWTSLAADIGATVAIDADGVGGVVQLTTAATDNNEAGLFTTNEAFLLAAGKSLHAGVRLQFAEANTDDANVAFGFGDALGANVLLDDGAGVSTSFTTCILIYKIDGGTVWRFHAENGANSETYTSALTAGGSSYQWLEIFGNVVDGVIDEYEFTFRIDGLNVLNTDTGRPLKLNIPYASATEMDFGVYAKAGGANSEVVSVDKIFAYQTT